LPRDIGRREAARVLLLEQMPDAIQEGLALRDGHLFEVVQEISSRGLLAGEASGSRAEGMGQGVEGPERARGDAAPGVLELQQYLQAASAQEQGLEG
jgi:hypothetical protein